MSRPTDTTTAVAVCSRSFSQHPVLREELLARYRNVTFNDEGRSLHGSELVEFLRGHTKAVIALERITDGVLSELPELRVISKYGVGLDNLDLEALRRRGVSLGWTPGVNRRSVAELVIACALLLVRNLLVANTEVRNGEWRQLRGGLLSNRRVGIVGLGNVGREVARLLQPFECEVWAHDIVEQPAFCEEHGVRSVDLDTLLSGSEIVTIHLPLEESTRGLIGREQIRLLREGAYLINTARGGIVDEQAVLEGLLSGRIAGAAFDVFEVEPPQERELLALPNFIATPHIGGSSHEAVLAMGRAAIQGLDADAEGAVTAAEMRPLSITEDQQ